MFHRSRQCWQSVSASGSPRGCCCLGDLRPLDKHWVVRTIVFGVQSHTPKGEAMAVIQSLMAVRKCMKEKRIPVGIRITFSPSQECPRIGQTLALGRLQKGTVRAPCRTSMNEASGFSCSLHRENTSDDHGANGGQRPADCNSFET